MSIRNVPGTCVLFRFSFLRVHTLHRRTQSYVYVMGEGGNALEAINVEHCVFVPYTLDYTYALCPYSAPVFGRLGGVARVKLTLLCVRKTNHVGAVTAARKGTGANKKREITLKHAAIIGRQVRAPNKTVNYVPEGKGSNIFSENPLIVKCKTFIKFKKI